MSVTPEKDRITAYGLKLILICMFGIAMAYFEATVVVYLRELYYPGGFSFPLKVIPRCMILIELFREVSTIIMIIAVAALAGKKFWERFGYFIVIFGLWDIFYYLWLKAIIDWPSSLLEWDILFLIPLPWIGPVIAPALVALLMVIGGFYIIRIHFRGLSFKPGLATWICWIIATTLILYSFMHDTDATINLQMPRPYLYILFIPGLVLYIVGYLISHRRATRHFTY